MRQSEIEGEYKRLIQEPEIQQSFEKSRQLALNEIFGKDLNNRVQGQANYLLNDSFQQELDKLPEAEIQARIQQELSALAILNPAMAKKVGQELIQKTVIHQALKTLQDPGEAGDSMREGLSQALGLYLKAQQTAASVTLQASNFSRLVNISDQQIDELTQAVDKEFAYTEPLGDDSVCRLGGGSGAAGTAQRSQIMGKSGNGFDGICNHGSFCLAYFWYESSR